MKELKLNVEGMVCTGCENRIKKALSTIEGVKKVKANHKEKLVTLKISDNVDLENIKKVISDLGFEVIEK